MGQQWHWRHTHPAKKGVYKKVRRKKCYRAMSARSASSGIFAMVLVIRLCCFNRRYAGVWHTHHRPTSTGMGALASTHRLCSRPSPVTPPSQPRPDSCRCQIHALRRCPQPPAHAPFQIAARVTCASIYAFAAMSGEYAMNHTGMPVRPICG